MGFKAFSDIFGISSQEFNQISNNPKLKDMVNNNILNDPSLLEIAYNDPEIKKIIQNDPILKFGLQNPQLVLSPQIMQMTKNLFNKDEKSMIESSNTEVPVPPDPFEKSQMLNSSRKI